MDVERAPEIYKYVALLLEPTGDEYRTLRVKSARLLTRVSTCRQA